MTTTTSTLETIKRIASNVHKYAKGGTYSYEGNGWSHTCGTKEVKFYGEVQELKRLAKREDIENIKCGIGLHLVFTDKATDTEYAIVYEPAQYIGRPDKIMADITYNVTVANS
jgi:hypothetical protein